MQVWLHHWCRMVPDREPKQASSCHRLPRPPGSGRQAHGGNTLLGFATSGPAKEIGKTDLEPF